jgi:glycosyltransferase involved in cell wall biosynthesis
VAVQAQPRITPDSVRLNRRILFCTWGYFPSSRGGAERQAQLQAEELTRRGHHVEVVCLSGPGIGSGAVNGVWVHRLSTLKRRRLRTASYLLRLLLFLLRRLREFDLVMVHLGYFHADVAAVVGRILRRPVWVKLAASGPLGEIRRMKAVVPFNPFVGLRWASRVQAISEEIEREVLSIGVQPSRLVRIPNGVDTRRFASVNLHDKTLLRQQLHLPQDGLIVIFAGRFAKHKGLSDLLHAWRQLRPANAILLAIGSTATMDALEVPRDEDICVVEWTDRISEYFQASDVFVLPSYVEGMSNAMLEAMACGLAVVATPVGASAEIIEHRVNGLLVDVGDATGIRMALAELLSDATMRARLGKFAAQTIRDRFTIESVVDLIEAEQNTMQAAR